MDNTAALNQGAARMRTIVDAHIANEILVPAAQKLITDATQIRIHAGHNMTGNTINSYAAGVYVRGALTHIVTSSGTIPSPLQRKLGLGQKFHRGRQRWDGEIQKGTFTAKVATNGTTEAERCLAFIRSYKAPANGYAVVVCNGVEYAEYQEFMCNVDVLTQNFNNALSIIQSSFKPLSN